MLAAIVLAGPLEGKVPDSVATLLLILTFFLAVFGSCILFNERSQRWPYQTIEELENQGLVTSTEYQARRALQVEEFEDEGSHYFLELNDGSVLFLSGQYLYDYEPIDDDPEANQHRRFPCTDFVVKRHKTEEYVLEIVTRGTAFEPEAVAPYFTESDYQSSTMPEDGDIIRGTSFDEIKRERLKS